MQAHQRLAYVSLTLAATCQILSAVSRPFNRSDYFQGAPMHCHRSLVAIAGLGMVFFAVQSRARADSDPVQSKDKRVQVVLPIDWEPATLPNAIGKLQAKCTAKNAYLQIVSEAKEDFDHNSLQEYADTILKIEADKTKSNDRKVTGPQQLTINGHNVLRYESRQTLKNVKLVFVKTFVETPKRWNQIIVWTVPSEFDEVQDDIQKIVNSFEEVQK
jgi:hypothetical protein